MDGNTYILDFLLESQQNVVFVPNVDIPSINKTACAFANTRGGTLLVGVKESGVVVGVDTGKSLNKILESLDKDISPSLPFIVSPNQKEDKHVLIISVWEGPNKPYVTEGKFYIQKGNAIVSASSDEVVDLFKEKHALDGGWERKVQGIASVSDLDVNAIAKIRNALIEKNKQYIDAPNDTIVNAMGFGNDGLLTNAGVVVMTKQPSMFLPQTRIRVSVFADEQGQPSLIDVRLYDINLIAAVDESADYLFNLYPKRVIVDGMIRYDLETLPLLAIREGLLNAVVHRSYESYQSFVTVNAYADRLVIINSGDLMKGVTLEGLKGTHLSVLRNPDIANAFYQLRYIEMVGSGTLRIIEVCKQNRCDEPIWTIENDCVVLTFPNVHHHLQQLSKNEPIDISKLSRDVSVRDALSVILDYMTNHEIVKLQELTKVTGKSYPSVKRYMQLLKDAGLIEYSGNLRSGGWGLSRLNKNR